VSARLLGIITPGEEATALASLAGLVTIARAAGGDVRLAYLRELPPPRVDRHDRLVADTDREMARITVQATQSLDRAARVFDDVRMETVVRFGNPRQEAALEAETYRPAIIVHFSARRGWLARLRGWGRRWSPSSHRRHPSQHVASEVGVLGKAAASLGRGLDPVGVAREHHATRTDGVDLGVVDAGRELAAVA
jgi:hypothetical protein